MPRSNIFEAGTASIAELFESHLEGQPERASCIVLAVSARGLAERARDAVEKSFAALGYGRDACTYATLSGVGDSALGPVELDPQALFLLVEGLDPLFVVAADNESVRALAAAYRTQFAPNSAIRVFGRSSVAFDDLDALLATDDGKQAAWRLFKSIPKRA